MTIGASSHQPPGVVAVGASAGGVEALGHFAAGLPTKFPFAVAVVLHMPAGAPSVLAHILDRSGPLPAESAADGARMEAGRIYVARPGEHLLIDDGHIVRSDGPTENGHRPAINALFRSAALAYGQRAFGLLLSGVLDDGVLGLAAIRSRGGTAIVQEPSDALFSSLPSNAIHAGEFDLRAPASEMGRMLMEMANRKIDEPERERDPQMELENRMAMGRRFVTSVDSEQLGSPSGYTCPDCNGSLQTVGDENFRCHVGHAWTPASLLYARDREVENALWIALRSLQEKATLARRMAEHAGNGELHRRYTSLADETQRAATVLSTRLSESYSEAEGQGVS
jgi:two-component system chemotaxis response regulator CheB